MKEINKLLLIQSELKAPKDLVNKFANYNYRSCESILEALKPLLLKHELTLTLTDDVLSIGNRVYVKATATLHDPDGKAIGYVTAFAREEEVKKGMDTSQITGAASSYARKYALNGLFLIDDNKDSDHTNDGADAPKQAVNAPSKPQAHAPAQMSPSGPNPVKTVIGNITKHTEYKGWHKFTVDGIDLSTNTDIDRDKMLAYMEDDTKVAVEYSQVPSKNPKYPDTRYIKGISKVEEVPF